jgi:hypothetical protein
MSKTDQFWQYAKEAILAASNGLSEARSTSEAMIAGLCESPLTSSLRGPSAI